MIISLIPVSQLPRFVRHSVRSEKIVELALSQKKLDR